MEIASFVIGACALFASGFGLWISFKSNRISEKSNALASSALEFQNRPWLHSNIIQANENGDYLVFARTKEGIKYSINFSIENKGNTPANDIRLPGTLKFEHSCGTGLVQPMNFKGLILGQGQKFAFCVDLYGSANEGEASEKYFDGLLENPPTMSLSMIVTYRGVANPDTEFSTETHFKVSPKGVDVTRGNFK